MATEAPPCGHELFGWGSGRTQVAYRVVGVPWVGACVRRASVRCLDLRANVVEVEQEDLLDEVVEAEPALDSYRSVLGDPEVHGAEREPHLVRRDGPIDIVRVGLQPV